MWKTTDRLKWMKIEEEEEKKCLHVRLKKNAL